MSDQGAARPIRVLIADSEPDIRERYSRWLSAQPDMDVVGLAQDGQEAAQLAVQMRPDVLLMDEDMPQMNALDAAQMVSLAAPQIITLLTCQSPGPQIWRDAMRAGVRDCLQKTEDPQALVDAIRKAWGVQDKRRSPEFAQILDPARMPRVVSITGAKGGVGKTTIATNLAVDLAQQYPGQVLLLDVYAQFGDVALMMNLRPKRTLVELVPLADEMDAELLDAYLTSHPSGLKVLVGSSDPLELNAISVKCLSATLNILKRSYRYIVMDVPPMLYETTIHALTHSSYVFLVANLYDLTTVNDTRKLYRTLVREYVPREKLRIVLNRVSRHNRLQASEIERTFGQGITAQIPNAGHVVVSSVNEGRPFVLTHPSSPVSRSIRALATTVTAPLGISNNGVSPAHGPLPDLAAQGEGA
jgi:pilus assembly protein CpaE